MKRASERYKELPVQVKASFWFLMCSFFQRGVSMLTTPIFTRLFTTTEYGEFSMFNSWMQIITPIVSLNLFAGVYSQGVVKFEDDRNYFSSSLQGLSLTLVSAWLVIYLVFKDAFNTLLSMSTVQVISMFVMIWAGGAFSFWSMDQRVDYKYAKLVMITAIVSLVQPVAGIIAILHSSDKVTARIVSMTVVQFLFYFSAFASQMLKGRRFFSSRYWKYALKFNIPLLPHYLSLTILSSSDRIMIGNMVSSTKAGIYNLAYSVSLIMTMFNSALLQTIEPWIYRRLKNKEIKNISSVAYICFAVIAAVNLLLILFAPEIISIFAPAAYYEAIWIVPSVALSVIFMFMYTFFATFEFYFEKTKYIASATVGGAVLNIVLNYIFINRFGYMAAGYTTLFSYILFAILHYYFMKKICRQYLDGERPYNGKIILGGSAICIFLGFLGLWTYKALWLRYSVIIAIVLFSFLFRKKLKNIVNMFVEIKKQK